MKNFKNLFKKENMALALISLFLTANSIFLVVHKLNKLSYTGTSDYSSLIFFIYFVLSVFAIGIILFFNDKFNLKSMISKLLLVFFPVQLIMLYEINWIKALYCISTSKLCLLYNNFVPLFTATYFLLLGYAIIKYRQKKAMKLKEMIILPSQKQIVSIAVVFIIFAINMTFGLYHLPKMAAVDEALWTFDRIPKYWSNIFDWEWQKTSISDKPGITVALISGVGLNWINSTDYKFNSWKSEKFVPENILKLNFYLRFPILLFNGLMIFAFYFLLSKLLGNKIATLGSLLIGLSPILLGISTIINPDSLLWVFVPLSMLSYFVYKKEGGNSYLYWAGILLGLSILTKYVANILYVFYFGLIFLEYIFNPENEKNNPIRYLKKSISDYAILVFFSLLTFMILLPATWMETGKLLKGTILSDAFIKVWPIFAGIISLLIIDAFFTKGKMLIPILNFSSRHKRSLFVSVFSIFLFSSLLAFFNTYFRMRWFDFESILASPKSSYINSQFLGLWGANFYSLIFGIMPLAFLSLVYISMKNIRKFEWSRENSVSFYLVLFIILYYFGSTINNVSATARYQIIIYPIALIVAAIGIKKFLELFQKYRFEHYAAYILITLISLYSLNFIKPFYFSYASSLLPSQYVLNLKDMGDGSYEAAQYLNSLPNARYLRIWTDKSGVCNFFIGEICNSSVEDVKDGGDFDYFVVSAGRESRTSKMTLNRFNGGNSNIIRLDKLYEMEGDDLEWKLEIGERRNNFVKIIKSEKLSR